AHLRERRGGERRERLLLELIPLVRPYVRGGADRPIAGAVGVREVEPIGHADGAVRGGGADLEGSGDPVERGRVAGRREAERAWDLRHVPQPVDAGSVVEPRDFHRDAGSLDSRVEYDVDEGVTVGRAVEHELEAAVGRDRSEE